MYNKKIFNEYQQYEESQKFKIVFTKKEFNFVLNYLQYVKDNRNGEFDSYQTQKSENLFQKISKYYSITAYGIKVYFFPGELKNAFDICKLMYNDDDFYTNSLFKTAYNKDYYKLFSFSREVFEVNIENIKSSMTDAEILQAGIKIVYLLSPKESERPVDSFSVRSYTSDKSGNINKLCLSSDDGINYELIYHTAQNPSENCWLIKKYKKTFKILYKIYTKKNISNGIYSPEVISQEEFSEIVKNTTF